MGCSGGGETIPVGDPTHPVEDLLIGGAVLAWQKAALSEAQRDEARQDRESESALLLDVAIPALAQALADLDDTTVTGRQAGKDRIGEALTRLQTGRLGMGRGARVMSMRETITTYARFVESEHARAEKAEAERDEARECIKFLVELYRIPMDEHDLEEWHGNMARNIALCPTCRVRAVLGSLTEGEQGLGGTADAVPVGTAAIKEPDAMGCWSDCGDVVWLPQSLYPKRIAAIQWAMHEWGVTLPEVSCLRRWLRYDPYVAEGYTREDGTVDPGWSEDRWLECEPDEPGAFRVWRLESA